MCGDKGLVTMGTVSDGGRERRAEMYVRLPGKGTRSWGINLRWDVRSGCSTQLTEGDSLAERPQNKLSFQHQFVRYVQSRMRYRLIVI